MDKTRLIAPEAETAVLGAVVVDPSILGWLDLTDEHFKTPAGLAIYRAMRKLYEDDSPLDEVTILDAIDAGGNSGVGLKDVMKVLVASPTADNAEYWVEILEEKRRLRAIAEAIAEATKILSGERVGDSAEIQNELLADLAQLSAQASYRCSTLAIAATTELERMENQWEGGASPRTPLGIRELDAVTGGVPIGVLSALGARTGVGKSTVLWNVMANMARRGDPVLVMSNEDRPDVMARMSIANRTGIERRDLLAGKVNELDKVTIRAEVAATTEANERFHTMRIHGRSMREICREATALIRRHGIKAIAIDYIQNVPSPKGVMNRNYGIEDNLTVLESMVADEDIVCIIVGQIKRLEDGATPRKQDFKDSGSIEQKCKLMMVLTDGDYEGIMDVHILKNSEGRENESVSLQVNKGYGRIS